MSPLQLIEARLAVEPFTTRLAVLHATRRNLDDMEAVLVHAEESVNDKDSFSKWDGEFHLIIAHASGNPLLINVYRQINHVRLHAQWDAMKEKILTPNVIAVYTRQHRGIFNALNARDAQGAYALITQHLEKADLWIMVMGYGHVYVARVAFGARDAQTVKAFQEAESWHGPSLILAYSHCIAHGYDMALGPQQQKLAVESGFWPLYRFDPRRVAEGQPPLHVDSGPPKVRLLDYMRDETRFRMAERTDPDRFKRLLDAAQKQVSQHFAVYQQLAGVTIPEVEAPEERPRPADVKRV